jgi:hypothetical protein
MRPGEAILSLDHYGERDHVLELLPQEPLKYTYWRFEK